jgi:hypothetical protein
MFSESIVLYFSIIHGEMGRRLEDRCIDVVVKSPLAVTRSRPTSDLGAVSFRNCPPGSASIRDIAY